VYGVFFCEKYNKGNILENIYICRTLNNRTVQTIRLGVRRSDYTFKGNIYREKGHNNGVLVLGNRSLSDHSNKSNLEYMDWNTNSDVCIVVYETV
jgi:hypothetical protein